MPMSDALRLEFADGRAGLTTLAAINDALTPYGSRVWALSLRDKPADVRRLLGRPGLTASERQAIMDAFLLPRERLLEIISEAGRAPQVPGGGEMATYVEGHDYGYPQLYLTEPSVDYTRFDRFHVNTADDGTGVDEFMQVLSGGGVRILQRIPEHGVVTLTVDCPTQDDGWIVTYSGAYAHIGSLSRTRPGTKVLMQIIGPARWRLRYTDDEAKST